jgi:hypothetical protein
MQTGTVGAAQGGVFGIMRKTLVNVNKLSQVSNEWIETLLRDRTVQFFLTI